MKALQRAWLLLGMCLCTAVSASAQPVVGALAIEYSPGDRYGRAVDHETAEAAGAAALRDCGAGCSVELKFERCGAYVGIQNSTGGVGVLAESTVEARLAGLWGCMTRSGMGCVVRVWACNSHVVEEELVVCH